MIEIPVSFGEIIDKITILEIKAQKINDDIKRQNVALELSLLQDKLGSLIEQNGLDAIVDDLRAVNTSLWDVENALREYEDARRFDEAFIALARSVYITNDRRADLKRQINARLGSTLMEEKSYKPYAASAP
ncbi:DUF6165 family protein [Agrobacterium rubi]|uniref:Uncharacterized protein n=1 Tax=Agrobacterium rubi TaxID=28099 RepID=A0AAE7R4L9_9HYPH|nr:DUF6165 family protein [Agrobacterium rubi]NTE86894.1 hypothetical protein [Agrobacterium rubi]NTF02828.1 hypothetical protein [Agrobacterium rubi]NTF37072.1 hypothetical protein [Agrobacterium rubi]OCJ55337.1 hypothetical protein A6U92_01650 [Agrobacterium rubi]QTF99506.1 hypothetical protein G6M88_03410 [Agrobacterium rubi]